MYSAVARCAFLSKNNRVYRLCCVCNMIWLWFVMLLRLSAKVSATCAPWAMNNNILHFIYGVTIRNELIFVYKTELFSGINFNISSLISKAIVLFAAWINAETMNRADCKFLNESKRRFALYRLITNMILIRRISRTN